MAEPHPAEDRPIVVALRYGGFRFPEKVSILSAAAESIDCPRRRGGVLKLIAECAEAKALPTDEGIRAALEHDFDLVDKYRRGLSSQVKRDQRKHDLRQKQFSQNQAGAQVSSSIEAKTVDPVRRAIAREMSERLKGLSAMERDIIASVNRNGYISRTKFMEKYKVSGSTYKDLLESAILRLQGR